jgi:hypothetical protein
MAQFGKFGLLRQMISNGSDPARVIDAYFNLSFSSFGPGTSSGVGVGAINQLFMHSIPHPAIAHFSSALRGDPSRVLVVNADELGAASAASSPEEVTEGELSALRSALTRVHAFLGVQAAPRAFEGPTAEAALRAAVAQISRGRKEGARGASDHCPLSQAAYRRITRFFAPFVAELDRVSGLNVSASWSTRAPPSYLALAPPHNISPSTSSSSSSTSSSSSSSSSAPGSAPASALREGQGQGLEAGGGGGAGRNGSAAAEVATPTVLQGNMRGGIVIREVTTRPTMLPTVSLHPTLPHPT